MVASNSAASASGAAIGEPTRAQVKAALLSVAGQDQEVAQNLKDAADTGADKAIVSSAKGTNNAANTATTAAGSSNDNSASPAQSAGSSQQTWALAANDAVTLVQSDASDPGRATVHTAAALTTASVESTGASNAQGTGAANTVADSLPNFGFSGANSTASANATSGSANTGAVPIAGLAVAIAARAQEGSNQFDIRLDPPELGRIDVRLDVDTNGQVTSHVTVERADTLALLQNQQPQLERALEQAGLKTADNGLSFTLRDQSFAGQNNNDGGAQPNQAQLVIPEADLPPVSATQVYSRLGLGGGLDIRV